MLGRGTLPNHFSFGFSAFPTAQRSSQARTLAGVHHHCLCASVLLLALLSCEGGREREQGTHPVMPGSTFLQGSRWLGDTQRGLLWTPHPVSRQVGDKHHRLLLRAFPIFVLVSSHSLTLPQCWMVQSWDWQFFTLERHRPGGKHRDDGSHESEGADPAPSAPLDSAEDEPCSCLSPSAGSTHTTSQPHNLPPRSGVLPAAQVCCCRRGVSVCVRTCKRSNPRWPWTEGCAPHSQAHREPFFLGTLPV